MVTGGVFFAIWAGIRYFLPLSAPFLLGWFFAAMAEPAVQLLHGRLKINRAVASGISVTVVLMMILGVLCLLGALCYREITVLASKAPEYAKALSGRIGSVREWAVGLVSKAPGSLGQMLSGTVGNLFAGSGVLLERVTSGVISMAGSAAGRIPGGALMIGTSVVSGYMISAQYPSLKRMLTENDRFRRRWEPVLLRLRNTVRQWLWAQLKLSGLTFGIVAAGFLILRVDQPLMWAGITAVVDAVPILGTGTVLVPMALFSFLWGQKVQGIGLIALYITALLIRSAMEPRLVGRQLGLNPLATLMALYVGFRLWGVAGMILSPILAVSARQLIRS